MEQHPYPDERDVGAQTEEEYEPFSVIELGDAVDLTLGTEEQTVDNGDVPQSFQTCSFAISFVD